MTFFSTLFPRIDATQPIPRWWLGIAYYIPETKAKSYRCAPLLLAHLIAAARVVFYAIRFPYFAHALFRRDDLARLTVLDRTLWQKRVRNGELAVENDRLTLEVTRLTERNAELDSALTAAVHALLSEDRSNLHWGSPTVKGES